MNIKKYYIGFTLIYIIFCIYIVIVNSLTKYGMLDMGDTPPFYKSMETYLELLYTSWINGAYGTSFYGYAGHGSANYLLFWVLGFLFHGDMILAQRIYVLLPLFVSPISFYILSSKFLKHDTARFASIVIYFLNFVSIQFFLGLYTIYQAYALLPLVVYSCYSVMDKPNILNILKLATLIGLADILWPQSILIMIPWIILLSITRFFTIKDLHSYKRSLIALVSGVVFGVFGLGLIIYIEPFLSLLMGKTPSIYAVPITEEFIIEEVVLSFHNEASINNGLALTFMTAPALLLLLHTTKLKHKFYVFEFSLVFSLLSLYYWIATVIIIPKSFASLIAMLGLTEPWKVQLSLVLCLSILLGALFDYLLDLRPLYKRFIRCFSLRHFIFITLFLVLLIANFTHNYYNDFPTTGLITGYNPYRPNHAVVDPSFYQIEQLMASLIPSSIPYRILWLPSDPYTDSLVNSIFYRDQIVPSWSSSIRVILEPIINNSTVNYGHILSQANIRAIVVNIDPSSTATQYLSWYQGVARLQRWGFGEASAWYAVGDPEYYVAFMNQQKDLRPVYNSKRVIIYENLAYVPLIQAYQAVTVVQDSLIHHPYSVTYSGNMLNTSLLGWHVTFDKVQGGLLRYSVETPNGNGYSMIAVNNGSSYFLVEQYLKIRNDKQYIISGWIKTRQVLYSLVQIAFFDSEGKRVEVQNALPWISGDLEWTPFAYQVIPPANSSLMAVYLWPGQKGTTMYYNLSLVEGYMVYPNVSSNEICGEISQLKSPVNFSSTLLLLNRNTTSSYISKLTTLYPYLPDQSLIPLGGYWLHGSNHSVVVMGEFAADFPIYVAEDGNYQLLISGNGITGFKLATKSGEIELLEMNNGYIMSKAFYLRSGKHNIYLFSNSSKISLDLLLLIKVNKEIGYTNLLEIINSKPPIFMKFLSLTEYFVEVPSHNYPLLVFMGQTYNPHWVFVGNEMITSQPLEGIFFTGNAFVIDSSANKVAYRLVFMSDWPFIVNIWLGLWSVTMMASIALYVVCRRRSHYKC